MILLVILLALGIASAAAALASLSRDGYRPRRDAPHSRYLDFDRRGTL